ncbi:MAG: glycosyltransferase family 2 protein [Elainellaceae cyanobacterium]
MNAQPLLDIGSSALTLILLAIALIGVLVPVLVLALECFAALLSPKPDFSSAQPPAAPVDLAIIMPAHNEAAVIRPTLETLKAQLEPGQRLIVVADNCTDETAQIARSLQVEVIERFDAEKRGKGYALDYGLRHITDQPPTVVIFVDADSEVEAGTIASLAQMAIATQRPVQAVYTMETPPQPSPKDVVSAFAFKVKNLVRPLGLRQLGQPCLLTGTGMAFPWSVIRSVELASGNIVEDMKLGFDLAIAGYSPVLGLNAHVIGRLPQQADAATSQRTRWEHGHLKTLLTYGPQLFRQAIQQRRLDLLALAFDICVPPLSLLVVLWFGVTVVTLLAALVGLSWIPAAFALAAGGLLVAAILTAWAGFARTELPIGVLLQVPLYVLWKIPLYLKFLGGGQSTWVRTERDAANPPES